MSPSAAPGAVTFNDGATPLCSNVLLSNGIAPCSISLTTAGSHSITATYGGPANYAASTTPAVVQTITDQRAKTVETIGQFLSRRTDQILSNGPDGGRQIDRLNEVPGSPGTSTTPSLAGTTLTRGGAMAALLVAQVPATAVPGLDRPGPGQEGR